MLHRIATTLSLASLCAAPALWAEEPSTEPQPDPQPALEEMLAEMPTLDEEADESSTHVHAFPLVQYKQDGERKKVKVGNAIIAQGYTHRENGDSEHTKVLNVPFASLAKVHKHGDETETRVLNAPFTSLVRKKSDEESTEVKVLKVPLFTLAQSETNKDGTFDRKFLKLPIVGSLFRHTKTEDERRVRFLFFRHKKKLKHDDEQDGL